MDKVLWSHRYNATTSDVDLGVNDSNQNPAAQTVLALVYPTGAGESSNAYIVSKVPSAGNAGLRLIIVDTAGTPAFRLGFHSSSSPGNPLRVASTVMTYNDWWHIAGIWTGSVTATTIQLYQGVNGAPLAEVAYASATNGVGVGSSGTGENLHIGNRTGNDRTHNGDIAYVARWNRVLSLQELLYAQRHGPLSVRDGLILCWANGRDYSPSRLMPIQTRALGTGMTPPHTPLTSRRRTNNFATNLAAAGFNSRYYYDMITGRSASA